MSYQDGSATRTGVLLRQSQSDWFVLVVVLVLVLGIGTLDFRL